MKAKRIITAIVIAATAIGLAGAVASQGGPAHVAASISGDGTR